MTEQKGESYMKNKKRGFTIVELVIVIAVIGILSAILIPTFANLSQKAQDAALQQNLRNAYASYTADKADKEDLKAEGEIVFTVLKMDDAQYNSKVYKLNAQNKWEEANKETTGTYTLLNAEAYNGYYIYYYNA